MTHLWCYGAASTEDLSAEAPKVCACAAAPIQLSCGLFDLGWEDRFDLMNHLLVRRFVARRSIEMMTPKQRERVSAHRRAVAPQLPDEGAFTLLELLVVITIIIVLISFLFPAFRGIQDQAKKTQAKNDLNQLAAAVSAFYTEYGRYPIDPTVTTGSDIYYGSGSAPGGSTKQGANDQLMDVLRNVTGGPNGQLVTTLNPRQIVFIAPPDVKDETQPKSGIATKGVGNVTVGSFVDPWGSQYNVEIDQTYNTNVGNPYTLSGGAGNDPLAQGVISWSFGADGQPGNNGDNKYKDPTTGTQSDDVISWQ